VQGGTWKPLAASKLGEERMAKKLPVIKAMGSWFGWHDSVEPRFKDA